MKSTELWAFNYLLNSLWQIPVIWFAAWITSRLVRKTGPHIEHRIWVGSVTLAVLLPACNFQLGDLWRLAWSVMLPGAGVHGGEIRILPGSAEAIGSSPIHMPPLLIAMILVAYAGGLAYFAARLAWGFWITHVMLRRSQPIVLEGDLAESVARSSRILNGIKRFAVCQAVIAESPMVGGPVTVGLRRNVLLVPPAFFQNVGPADIDALLTHEFAHMRRRDFAKNLLYGVLSLPACCHPLSWIIRARVAETRELICDAMAAEAVAGRENYAHSLLRLASMLSTFPQHRALQAIAIFDANNFERRIMDLKQKRVEVRGARRFAIVTVCAAIALGACASALALRMEVTDPETQNPAPKPMKVNVKEVKILHKQPPVYPVQAKASGDTINGTVQLDVVIGITGEPENIRVKKSLREDYDKSAIDAIRNWRWEPFHLNGQPTEVITTVNITYSLKK